LVAVGGAALVYFCLTDILIILLKYLNVYRNFENFSAGDFFVLVDKYDKCWIFGNFCWVGGTISLTAGPTTLDAMPPLTTPGGGLSLVNPVEARA
jgi:hypothetical protein